MHCAPRELLRPRKDPEKSGCDGDADTDQHDAAWSLTPFASLATEKTAGAFDKSTSQVTGISLISWYRRRFGGLPVIVVDSGFVVVLGCYRPPDPPHSPNPPRKWGRRCASGR